MRNSPFVGSQPLFAHTNTHNYLQNASLTPFRIDRALNWYFLF